MDLETYGREMMRLLAAGDEAGAQAFQDEHEDKLTPSERLDARMMLGEYAMMTKPVRSNGRRVRKEAWERAPR